MKQFVIKDFGNEYIIYRDSEEICTCYSPEDAERTASLMFQLEEAKAALMLIANNQLEQYCADAFDPDDRYTDIRDVARHTHAMVCTYDDGYYVWDLPCPECDGQGCEVCNWEGSYKSDWHPSFQRPLVEDES